MLASARRAWRSIRRGKAGSRFRDHYHRSSNDSHSRHRGWFIALGVVLMVLGALLSIPPGVPGFIVVLIGAAVISSRSHWAATKFDRLEHWLRDIVRKVTRRIPLGRKQQADRPE
jgi:hypothetical protein